MLEREVSNHKKISTSFKCVLWVLFQKIQSSPTCSIRFIFLWQEFEEWIQISKNKRIQKTQKTSVFYHISVQCLYQKKGFHFISFHRKWCHILELCDFNKFRMLAELFFISMCVWIEIFFIQKKKFSFFWQIINSFKTLNQNMKLKFFWLFEFLIFWTLNLDLLPKITTFSLSKTFFWERFTYLSEDNEENQTCWWSLKLWKKKSHQQSKSSKHFFHNLTFFIIKNWHYTAFFS